METIPSSMQSVICYAPRDFKLEHIPVPDIGHEEVLVRVLAVGICAGDAKRYHGAPYFWEGHDGKPPFVEAPVILGHEFIGEVVALGPGAQTKYNLAIGDLAVSENIVPCWKCSNCIAGKYNLCLPHDIYGAHQRSQGAMAQYMKFPKGAINHKVPKSIPPWKGAFIEPLACSVHAVNLADIQCNDVVVISGCGALGIGMVAAAKLKSPKMLIALDLFNWKTEVAKECGANFVFNPTQCNVVQEVSVLTDKIGCTIYIEASGNPASVKQGLDMLCHGGKFIEFGVFGRETSIDWGIISIKEITVKGGHLSPNTYPQAISMIENNQIPLERIITHQLPMSKLLEGIELVYRGDASIKMMVTIVEWVDLMVMKELSLLTLSIQYYESSL